MKKLDLKYKDLTEQ